MAWVHPEIASIVAHLSGVVDAVAEVAKPIEVRARGALAAHRRTGAASIEVEHGVTDTVVSLVDEAALSIEYGHTDARTGRPVEGLHIMRTAAG